MFHVHYDGSDVEEEARLGEIETRIFETDNTFQANVEEEARLGEIETFRNC